jgi:hypothetical protein
VYFNPSRKNNKKNYHTLAALARMYLPIQATSVAPCEPIFSGASHLISKPTRTNKNLVPDLASMVYISKIHEWFKNDMENTVVTE